MLKKIKSLFTTGRRKIAKNAIWMITEKIIRLLFGFIIGVWVARYLGPSGFGVYNYSISFVAFFLPFASLGLNSIITRELVRNRNKENSILGTVLSLRLFAGALSMALAFILIFLLKPSQDQVHLFIIILSFGQTLKSFIVLDFWYQSYVRSKIVVITRILVLILSNAIRVLGILTNQDILWFVLATFIEMAFSEVFLLITYQFSGRSILRWSFDKERAKNLLSKSWWLVFSSAAAVIYQKIDIIMISEYLTNTDVGFYSVAARISEVWYFVPISIVTSLFPGLLETSETAYLQYKKKLQNIFILLAIIGYLVAILATIFADPGMVFLFGDDFANSIPVLKIHIWAGIFISMRALLSKWILTEDLLHFSLITQGAGAIINIVANIILIPSFGIKGAAIATLVSYASSSYFSLFIYKRTREIALMMTKSLFFPAYLLQRRLRSVNDNDNS